MVKKKPPKPVKVDVTTPPPPEHGLKMPKDKRILMPKDSVQRVAPLVTKSPEAS